MRSTVPSTPVALSSFGDTYRAVVFGSSGGLGQAFVAALAADPRCAAVWAVARASRQVASARVRPVQFDLQDESSISAAVQMVCSEGPPDLTIVATGLLHDATLQPEKTLRSLESEALLKAFAINTVGPALIGKHLLPLLARDRRSVFAALSARVSSIADNRRGGWHAYRASKAALNMIMRNFAIELANRNRNVVCLSLHPGTVDTPLSQPFQSGVAAAQLFTPEHSAACLLRVIDAAGPDDSGCLLAWDGQRIPF